MSGHTPGSWYFDSEDDCIATSTEPSLSICVVQPQDEGGPKGFYSGPKTAAVISLIVSAPELLEALNASSHVKHTPPAGEGPCRCGQCAFVTLRDAAIAKATGATP